MDIIRQAAKRLEELRRAGIDMPWSPDGKPAAPTIDALARVPAAALGAERQLQRPAPRPSPPVDESCPARPVTLDLDRLTRDGILLPSSPRSTLVDEFRVIKRPLITNVRRSPGAADKRSNLIMVTSALPGEGKTFTSINLAMSISTERDCHVLLVDCDPTRPAALSRLGLPESEGLLDRLQNPSRDLSEFLLRPTNIERLTLLPAGNRSAYATELLASETMDQLLDEMATRFSDRIIIFDAPPLLPSTESQVIASRVGQVVFIVTANRTPLAAVKQALAKIESCPIVLPLLNKCRAFPGQQYYGYGYSYGQDGA